MLVNPSPFWHSFSTAPLERGGTSPPLGPQKSFNIDHAKDLWGFTGVNKGKVVQKGTASSRIVICIIIYYTLAKKLPPAGLKAHSIRTKAAQAHKVPVLDMCQATMWFSLHIFTKHYCINSQVPVGRALCPFSPAGFSGLSRSADLPPEKVLLWY